MSDSSEEEAEFTGEEVEPQEDGTKLLGQRRSSSSKKEIDYKEDEEDAVDETMEDVQGSNDNEDEDDDSDESDDDIPLAQLIKKKKPTPAKKKNGTKRSNGNETKKRKKEESKKRPTPKKKAASSTTSTNNNKSYEYASAALYGTECDKGLLIHRLLCRWWYAYQWPNINEEVPAGYDALEGFPGVCVCTETGHAEVGNIIDRRDLDQAPTFRNFATKPADELRDLLVRALTEQMKQLDDNDTTTQKQLTSMLKWAKAMNTSKADKDATKILKAHSLFEAS